MDELPKFEKFYNQLFLHEKTLNGRFLLVTIMELTTNVRGISLRSVSPDHSSSLAMLIKSCNAPIAAYVQEECLKHFVASNGTVILNRWLTEAREKGVCLTSQRF